MARDFRFGNSLRHNQINSLGAFPLLVGLDFEGDALPLGQILQARPFDCRDVNENITSSVVRLDEPVTALSIKKFNSPCHCHWEKPSEHRRPLRADLPNDMLSTTAGA